MTNREVMELADVIRYAGFDWEAFIDECRENGEEPHISYDEFLAQCVLESGLRKEREERSKGCRYCLNASIEPELEGCDLSYHDVGCSEKGYRFLVRAGNRKPVAILFEKWNNDGWHTIGIYEPNNCPMCGRKVKE